MERPRRPTARLAVGHLGNCQGAGEGGWEEGGSNLGGRRREGTEGLCFVLRGSLRWERPVTKRSSRETWTWRRAASSVQGCLNKRIPSSGPGIQGEFPDATRLRVVWEHICPRVSEGLRLLSGPVVCKKRFVRGWRLLSAACQRMEFDFKVIRQRLSGNTTAALKWKSRFQRLNSFRCDNVVLWA